MGSKSFGAASKECLGVKGEGRKVINIDHSYKIRESAAAHDSIFENENGNQRAQNQYI